MVDVRGEVLRPPHCTTPAAVKANKSKKMSSFKSNENIHKKGDGSMFIVNQRRWSVSIGGLMDLRTLLLLSNVFHYNVRFIILS